MFAGLAIGFVSGATIGVVFGKYVLSEAKTVKAHISAEIASLKTSIGAEFASLRAKV